jgi:hypothetical protein
MPSSSSSAANTPPADA